MLHFIMLYCLGRSNNVIRLVVSVKVVLCGCGDIFFGHYPSFSNGRGGGGGLPLRLYIMYV
jgi:hypothetical protein